MQIYLRKDFKDFVSEDQNYCQKYSTVADRPISNPHYNAFVDLNQDCMADLFITSAKDGQIYFEIYLKDKNKKLCLFKSERYGEPFLYLNFADISL